jgi:cGMP-dependent protein kinase
MVAENYTITAEITSVNIKKQFGSEIAEIIDRSKKIKIIKNIYLFSLFSEADLIKLLAKCDTRTYEAGEPIIQQGEDGNSLYMIAKGDVEIKIDGEFKRSLGKFEYFGERSLLFGEARSASVFATKEVEVLELDKKSFLTVIDTKIRQYLEYRSRLQDSNLDLSDLIIIDKLGYGNFGSVWKVMSAKNKTLYALKMVSRKKILEYDIEQNIKDERKILARIDHPFIMKLVKYYEEEHKIFFLTELVKGDDLFNALNYLNILDKDQSMFYFASLLLITEYLHLRNILYRDFKPENIMIDETGYLKLIDFGAAKIIKDRTYTIIGTPSYTAPEVYIGEGYSYTSDYWSLGVCLYEFLCGDLPFGGDNDMPDPLEVYKRILSGRLEFPSFYKDEEGKDLMRKMLHRDLEYRLTTIDDIRKHPYCSSFKFDDLIMRKIKAPFEPQIDDQILDPKNYQSFDELFRKDSRAMRMSFTNENGIEALKKLNK